MTSEKANMNLKEEFEVYDVAMKMHGRQWPFEKDNNINICYEAATASIQISEKGDSRVNEKCHEVLGNGRDFSSCITAIFMKF